jgi:hypothetical protein
MARSTPRILLRLASSLAAWACATGGGAVSPQPRTAAHLIAPCVAPVQRPDAWVTEPTSQAYLAWVVEEIRPETIDQWIDRYVQHEYEGLAGLDSATKRRMTASSVQLFHSHWDELVRGARPGDRFFYFTTPPRYWASLVGEDGIVLVRDCVIIRKADLMVS